MKKEYNEKQQLILAYIGKLVHERDYDAKLLEDNEKNRHWLEEFYDKKIQLLTEILEELK